MDCQEYASYKARLGTAMFLDLIKELEMEFENADSNIQNADTKIFLIERELTNRQRSLHGDDCS